VTPGHVKTVLEFIAAGAALAAAAAWYVASRCPVALHTSAVCGDISKEVAPLKREDRARRLTECEGGDVRRPLCACARPRAVYRHRVALLTMPPLVANGGS
jgi:hypothetical protein